MHDVTLYIPCFNAAKTIALVLEAVLAQSYPLKEVLVIDDGSTDVTRETASRYPVKLIQHKNNKGLASARNTAIENTHTEFIASLDADCVPEKDWLENLMKGFDASKIAGVGGKLLETHSSQIPDLWRSVHMKQYWDKEDAEPPFLFGSNTVFRKDALRNAGRYNEDFKNNYEDVDISRRMKNAGYVLMYEPKAISHHIREDSIASLLDRYWHWHLGYAKEENFYATEERFIFKLKENLGLSNRYIEEDVTAQRPELLYLDFLLAFHHSLKDFAYFISMGREENAFVLDSPCVSSWLALLDLTFFYHFDSEKKSLATLVPKQSALLQNSLGLSLVLGGLLNDAFKSTLFKRIFYADLLSSIHKIQDVYLLDRLLHLIENHRDWTGFFKKRQPHLNHLFLEKFFLNFQNWLGGLKSCLPEALAMIEASAQDTQRRYF